MAITITVPATPTSLLANTQLTAQTVDFSDEHTATADGITALQRLADISPAYFRLHMGTDGGIMLPQHVAFQGQTAYNFTNLNQKISDVFTRVQSPTLILNVRYQPDSMWTGTFVAFGASRANQGWSSDSTYATFSTYMANLVRYYNKNAVGFVNGPPTPATPPANTGPIKYWEILNECDFGGEEPWSAPSSLPAPPAPTLTKIAGGTLAAGTYTYQLAGLAAFDDQTTIAGTAASVTITAADVTAGTQSVNLTWTANKNLNWEPMAYRVFGRGASPTDMLVIGRDNAQAFNWTDTGSITPGSIVPPATSNITASPGAFNVYEYLKMWDTVVPAMKAVDSTIKVGGPVPSNLVSLTNGRRQTNPKRITTGPGQTTYADTRDWIQVLMADAVNKPDFVTVHQYGNASPGTDASYFSDIANTFVAGFNSNVWPYTSSTPVHLTEINIDPGPDAGRRIDFPYGAAWLSRAIAQLVNGGSSFQNLQGMQVHIFCGQDGFGIIGDGTGSHTPPGADGRPYCAYWVARYFVNLFPAGSQILSTAGVPANTDVLAIQSVLDSSKIKILVSNWQVPSTNNSYTLTISGGTVLAIRYRIIDSSIDTATGLRDGPALNTPVAAQSLTLSINGWGAAIVEFDLQTNNLSTYKTMHPLPWENLPK